MFLRHSTLIRNVNCNETIDKIEICIPCSLALASDRISSTMDPLELIYYTGYSVMRSLTLRRQKRLPCKVISVGNIATGGTGKTPAVIAIAEEAKRRGYLPCILTRGYKGKAKGPCFVKGSGIKGERAPDKEPLHELFGDEPVLMAERLKDVPIVKCFSRYEGGLFALKALSARSPAKSHQGLVFILDDGYQHWDLYRDMDILLIDSTNPFGNRRLLPSGILREPLKEINRANLIVITKTGPKREVKKELMNEIRTHNPAAKIYPSEHQASYLTDIKSNKRLPVDSISGMPVFGFCGIGNPGSLRETLLNSGAEIKGFMPFRDHHNYTNKDMALIKNAARKCGAEWIVTTEKDIIKVKGLELPDNLYTMGIEFKADEAFFTEMFREA